MQTAQLYRRFATGEARGRSALYEDWASSIAADDAVIALIDQLPEAKRQPNLVFGAARFAGLPEQGYASFRAELIRRWDEVRAIALQRRTQTNEAGRSAVLLPLLAALPQPLALIEVGASAGLCLFPDRFSYAYGDLPRIDPPDGPGPLLRCAIEGPVPIPAAPPRVAWRAGIDLNPLSVADEDAVRWLRTLVWPEQQSRRDQLDAAIAVARADPPRIIAGDLNDALADLIEQAPRDATLVVFHSAVLAYLAPPERARFVGAVRASRARWISNEAAGIVDLGDAALPPAADPARTQFVLALDGRPVGYADGHGASLAWFGADPVRD